MAKRSTSSDFQQLMQIRWRRRRDARVAEKYAQPAPQPPDETGGIAPATPTPVPQQPVPQIPAGTMPGIPPQPSPQVAPPRQAPPQQTGETNPAGDDKTQEKATQDAEQPGQPGQPGQPPQGQQQLGQPGQLPGPPEPPEHTQLRGAADEGECDGQQMVPKSEVAKLSEALRMRGYGILNGGE